MDPTTSAHDAWLVPRSISIQVHASPSTVYRLVSDVERIGEWSPECRSAAWLDDRRGAGARFRGSNRSGLNRWSRTCEVLVAEPDREFTWRTVPGGPLTSDSTHWGFLVEADGGGTLLTQRMQIVKKPQALLRPYIPLSMPHHLDMREQMQVTLDAIRAAAESYSST